MSRSKLSDAQKMEITEAWESRPTVKTLANKYGVHENTIKNVIYRWQERCRGSWLYKTKESA
jgi:hypothetical protein